MSRGPGRSLSLKPLVFVSVLPLVYLITQVVLLLSCSLSLSPGYVNHWGICRPRHTVEELHIQQPLRKSSQSSQSHSRAAQLYSEDGHTDTVDHHHSTDEIHHNDQERIKLYPHVKECKYCKVCVPDRLLTQSKSRQLLQELVSSSSPSADASSADDFASEPAQGLHLDLTGLDELDRQDLQMVQQLLPHWAAENVTAEGLQQLSAASRKLAQHLGGTLEYDIAPLEQDIWGVQDHKQCAICRGCNQVLEPMPTGTEMLGSYYTHEQDPRTRTGWSVAKVWCIPLMKIKQRALARCGPPAIIRQIKLLLAQQKITAECGLQDIVPRLWMEHVRGVVPGVGYPIDWQGMWFEVVPGVSLENIARMGKPAMNRTVLLDLFTNRINRTQVKMGAIFDTLFSQCDRNPQNMFMDDQGNIAYIDNDQAHATAWRDCGIDSMLIPTTQKFEINRLGYFYVMKYPPEEPPKDRDSGSANPMILLDYRCHVDGGKIGKSYWPKLTQCLKKLSGMTPDEVLETYGYPEKEMAVAVNQRAKDLLAGGFEWTVLHGVPRNPGPTRYKVTQPCCKFTYTPEEGYQCATKMDPDQELPRGDPYGGGKWGGTGNDTGSFDGAALQQSF